MKKILSFIFIISLFCISLYSQETRGTDENFKKLYDRIKERYSSVYPKRFESYIHGEIVERQISSIPSRNYTDSKDKVKLKFSFSQGSKPSMILENVDSFYRNMFSVFEGVLETVGFYAVVGSANNFSEFSSKFNFESMSENNREYKVTLRAKGEDEDYSVAYTVIKETLLIEKAEYYNKGWKIYDVDILYADMEEYILPEVIKYRSSDGKVNSEIKFSDVKIFKN